MSKKLEEALFTASQACSEIDRSHRLLDEANIPQYSTLPERVAHALGLLKACQEYEPLPPATLLDLFNRFEGETPCKTEQP